jgi:hypothetical protein
MLLMPTARAEVIDQHATAYVLQGALDPRGACARFPQNEKAASGSAFS